MQAVASTEVLTTNKNVLKWVNDVANITNPDQIMWIDGSEEQLDMLRQEDGIRKWLSSYLLRETGFILSICRKPCRELKSLMRR